MSARAVANRSDAPTPWTTRAATSDPMSGAKPHTAEAAVKITRPSTNTRRRLAGRKPTRRGGGGEDHEPEHEPAAPAAAVGEDARRQDGRGERQRVAVDDPLQARESRAEVAGHVGQGGVDDADVEHEHRR